MLDQAFDALKTYDWGVDPNVLKPIDEAVVKTHGDAVARKALEARIIPVLGADMPRAAKDYACRWLRTIGTEASVPALAALLPDKDLSHMARYALERIPSPEAGEALRKALPDVGPAQQIGIMGSLGVRGEDAAVVSLQALLGCGEAAVACSAAQALGAIGSPQAAKVLLGAKPGPGTKEALADASLGAAERLLAAGKKTAAKDVYQGLLGGKPTEAVKAAATRGLEAGG